MTIRADSRQTADEGSASRHPGQAVATHGRVRRRSVKEVRLCQSGQSSGASRQGPIHQISDLLQFFRDLANQRRDLTCPGAS